MLTLAAARPALRRDGFVAKHVLAKYVVAVGGGLFKARVKKWGKLIELPGPYPTERAAHLAMLNHLAHMPRQARPPKPCRLLISYSGAWLKLGIGEIRFTKHWLTVFTPSPDGRKRVFRDELEVAAEAGGGISDGAKEAVVLFRMGTGRL